jgi:hypothetical protein
MTSTPNWWTEEPIVYLLLAAVVILFFIIVIGALLASVTIFLETKWTLKWRWWIAQFLLILIISHHLLGQLLNAITLYGSLTKLCGWLACFALPAGLVFKQRIIVPQARVIQAWVLLAVLYILTIVMHVVWG